MATVRENFVNISRDFLRISQLPRDSEKNDVKKIVFKILSRKLLKR